MKPHATRHARILLAALAVFTLLLPATPTVAAPPAQTAAARLPLDLFGMVIRDPHYEYMTNPQYPNGPNETAQERMGAELEAAGVRWVRMEFFSDYSGRVPAGEINWNEYDYFIREVAPRHNLKVLALLNAGIVSYQGRGVTQEVLSQPPDESGSEDGSNHYMRVFRGRAAQIATRYADAIAAYELVNEPNINWELWNATGYRSAEIDPERFSTLMSITYPAIKAVAPQADVIIGGMLLGPPPNDRTHDELDWLYQVYQAAAVNRYRTDPHAGIGTWNIFPWDGIGLHPYRVDSETLPALLIELAQKARDRGDLKSKVWATEIGVEASPAPPDLPPSTTEQAQADYLRGIYNSVLQNPGAMAATHTIFWFKYEDFPAPSPTAHYGIVRLKETTQGYDITGAPYVRKMAYRAYQELARPGGSPLSPTDPALAAQLGERYFPPTGQAIATEFLDYWTSKGGLSRFGYPISQPVLINGYMSQIFQRAVFEYHPENAGTDYAVLLRRLGVEILDHAYAESDPFVSTADSVYFPETRHSASGVFLHFWQSTGGLPVYGYPMSEPVQEVSKADGQTYLVQYFERNRLEYHPANAGTEFEVQMGLLGSEMVKRDLWWR